MFWMINFQHQVIVLDTEASYNIDVAATIGRHVRKFHKKPDGTFWKSFHY